MDSLTKENFWDEISEKYPKSVSIFRVFLDEYKKRNNWNDLFPIVKRNDFWNDIKYHHLPIAMQLGIFIEFIYTCNGENAQIDIFKYQDITSASRDLIEDYFSEKEKCSN